MLADNIVLLKKKYPDLYKLIVDWKEKGVPNRFFIEKTKDGNTTLKYQSEEQTMYFHSKYNPIREAESIVDQLVEQEEILEDTQVVFYGIGLGYHIEAFMKRFPETAFIIVEPSVEILNIFLEQKLLKNLTAKNLKLIQCGNEAGNLFNQMMMSKDKHLVICEHPVYIKIFKREYQGFLEKFKTIIKEQRSSLHTNYAFKKRWIINSVNNFKFVLSTPNILMENNGLFEGKTAILVAAGPSLDFELENLRRIKEEGLAYIFTVGSAINTLINYNIYPDAMCTYDPSEKNQVVFEKVYEMEIISIPMIFGTSAVYETLQNYNGPKYHMITNQDTVSHYFLKSQNGEEIVAVNDAPSIAVVTLELLYKLKFDKIVLVGQNLAYLGKKNYAEGIEYQENREDVKESDLRLVKDVSGKEISTTDSFISMKKMMESYIQQFTLNVINTTIGGAQIEGAKFCELEKLLKKELSSKVVNGNELEQIIQSDLYDKKYMQDQIESLKRAYHEFNDLIRNILLDLKKLKDLVEHQKMPRIDKTHVHMDGLIRTLETNDFFKTIAMPINRVEYGILVNQIQNLKQENNTTKMTKNIIKPTESFIKLLHVDGKLYRSIMTVLENTVFNYCREMS